MKFSPLEDTVFAQNVWYIWGLDHDCLSRQRRCVVGALKALNCGTSDDPSIRQQKLRLSKSRVYFLTIHFIGVQLQRPKMGVSNCWRSEKIVLADDSEFSNFCCCEADSCVAQWGGTLDNISKKAVEVNDFSLFLFKNGWSRFDVSDYLEANKKMRIFFHLKLLACCARCSHKFDSVCLFGRAQPIFSNAASRLRPYGGSLFHV